MLVVVPLHGAASNLKTKQPGAESELPQLAPLPVRQLLRLFHNSKDVTHALTFANSIFNELAVSLMSHTRKRANRLIGYGRISTEAQDLTRQRQALKAPLRRQSIRQEPRRAA